MDKSIKDIITEQFTYQTGYIPNIDNPRTFNEKIQWLKLYYRDPLLTKCSDKYEVRDYISKVIGEEYLIPLIGVYENENEINFKKLPNKFVLKLNSGSGKNIICKDKAKLNIKKTRLKLNEWLKPESHHYLYSYEWAYKDIKSKIVCEKYLEANDLKDYKFMCFHGKVKNIFVCSERENKLKINFYDTNWKLLPFTRKYPNSEKELKKPLNFYKMIKIAEKLAIDFPFVRVDLYEVDNKIYFGELTFYPGNGMEPFNPEEYDYKLGKLINLAKIDKNKIIKCTTVTFFSHSSNLAGAERSMLELIKELREKNIYSHVVLPSKGPIQKELEENNIPYDVVDLRWWASIKAKNEHEITSDASASLQNLLEFLPKLKTINPDLIYSNTIVNPWGAIASKFINKPHIWHIREFGNLDHQLKFDYGLNESAKFVENNSELVIANSLAVSKHISNYFKNKKPEVVYNFVDIDKNLIKEKAKTPFRHKNSLKVLICGNIFPGKNQLEGIKAINELKKDKIDVELLILGTVSDTDYFKKIKEYIFNNKINNKVHFIEFVKNPYPYFLLSDIVLIPSLKEAYGRTAVEAMLLKNVVVASSEGGTKEIITNGETGFVYELGNIKELVNILEKLSDKLLRKTITENGLKSVCKFNSKETYGYFISEQIKKIVKNSLPVTKISPFTSNILQGISHELINIKNENQIVKSELTIIKDSKFFKLWPVYNKLKNHIKIR